MDVFFVLVVILGAAGVGVLIWLHNASSKKHKHEADRRRHEMQSAYEAWWRSVAGPAHNPETPPAHLRELAAAPSPQDPARRVAFIEVLRLLITNPSTPPELHAGILSRIGSEEAAIRMDDSLVRMQGNLKKSLKKGGGMMIGGGVSFPLD